MSVVYRLLVVFLLGLLGLAACSPSSNKPLTRKQPVKQTVPVQDAASRKTPHSLLTPEQYKVLASAQLADVGDKVEVLEFFAYFCSHCKAMDPGLTEWAKQNAGKIVFKRVPVAFRENMAVQQRMYFALETMGKVEEIHSKIFHAVQVEHESLGTDQEIFDFIAHQGIDQQKFKEMYESFGIQSKARNAALLQKAYQIDGVPMVAVDGRFMTSASLAIHRPGVEQTVEGAYRATLDVMSDLVEKVRKERTSAAKK